MILIGSLIMGALVRFKVWPSGKCGTPIYFGWLPPYNLQPAHEAEPPHVIRDIGDPSRHVDNCKKCARG